MNINIDKFTQKDNSGRQKKVSLVDWWDGMKQGYIGIQDGNFELIYQYDLTLDKFMYSTCKEFAKKIAKKEDYSPNSRQYFLFKNMRDYIEWIKKGEERNMEMNDFSNFGSINKSWFRIKNNQEEVVKYYNETSSIFKEQKFQTELVL